MVRPLSGFRLEFLLSEQLVAGVVGAGVFGGHHARKYATTEGVRLGAVYDVDYARARALADKHQATAYADYAAFLKAVDVVTIAAPATAHFALARTALAAGKHALLEKPLATTLDHADRLIALAERMGVVLQVGHQERFVADAFGVLRRPTPPRSIWCRRLNPKTGRGEDVSVVLDLMIHDLDLIRQLGLGDLKSVVARGDADDVETELEFEGGAMAILAASRVSSRPDRRMTFVYDDGVVEIDFVNRTVGNTTATPLAASFEDASLSPALSDPLGLGVTLFVDAVRNRRAAPICGRAGRGALEWALAIEDTLEALVQPEPKRASAGV